MLINHDPFSRRELHKEIRYTTATCSFCGAIKQTKTGKSYLYKYVINYDGGRGFRPQESQGLFCSIGCFRLYHN